MDLSQMPEWQASKDQYKDPEKNVWSNPDVHPLTHMLRSAFVPM